MTQNETNLIMAILTAAYPGYYEKKKEDDIKAIRDLWAMMFVDEPYELVQAAVRTLVKSRVYPSPPAIGEVTAAIYKLRHPDELTDAEAWQLVKRALRNSLYGASEEYARLPERVQRCIGSPSQLRDWATMDVDDLDSVVASNFRRAYSARCEYDREYEALPGDVREMLGSGFLKALPE